MRRHAAAALVVILALPLPSLGFAQGAAALTPEEEAAIEDAVDAELEDYEDDYVPAPPPAVGGAWACDSSGASGQIKGGGVSISIPTYPCEVARTFQTLDELDERGGFIAFTARQLLRGRLITRGIFSFVAGLFGLG